MPTPNESPEQIEDEIRGTRRDIDRTLDALQSKLSPGQILDQALAYAKDGGGEFAANLGRTISRNPVPLTLVGIGLAWLMCSGQGGVRAEGNDLSRRRSNGNYNRDAHEDLPEENRNYYSDSSSAAVGEAVQRGATRVRESIHDVRDTAAGYAQAVGGTASEMADRAGEYAQTAWDRGVRAKDSAAQTLQEYPVVVGVLGLAAGALAAAFLPSTRREDELMGGAADQLKRSTTNALKETVDEAAEAVQSAAEQHAHPEAGEFEGAPQDRQQSESH